MTREEFALREYELGYQVGTFLARRIINKHLSPVEAKVRELLTEQELALVSAREAEKQAKKKARLARKAARLAERGEA